MFDVIGDLLEFAAAGGVPSPDSLEKQRRARLAVSLVVLVGNLSLCLLLGASALGGWFVLVLGAMTVAAGWVTLFSVVDIAKELPSVVWLSIAAGIVGSAGMAVTALAAFGMIPTPG
jgi:hypothetical protein